MSCNVYLIQSIIDDSFYYKSARKHEVWLKKKSIDYKSRLAQLAPPELGGVK